MDIWTLAIGAAIGAVVAFATGFLKKAGEDLYTHIKKRYSPPSPEAAIPTSVVVNLSPPQEGTGNNSAIPGAAFLTPAEIIKRVTSAPVLQRPSLGEGYKGVPVEWVGYLKFASERGNGQIRVSLSADPDGWYPRIVFTVVGGDYPALRVSHEGTKIRVLGTIEEVEETEVRLGNACISFPP